MGTDQIRELGKQTPNGLHTVALWSCISPSILRAVKLKIHTGEKSNKCNQKWVYTHHTEHYSETSRHAAIAALAYSCFAFTFALVLVVAACDAALAYSNPEGPTSLCWGLCFHSVGDPAQHCWGLYCHPQPSLILMLCCHSAVCCSQFPQPTCFQVRRG